jgi:5-formyltetrahydrofolate cyclo-ligase
MAPVADDRVDSAALDAVEAAARDKAALRRWVLDRRAGMSRAQLAAAARRITDAIIGAPEIAAARCVAAYASFGREPGTRHLVDALAAQEVVVLLPVLRPGRDLDWAQYSGPGDLEPAAGGMVEPVGARFGVGAIARADVVLVPALAVDRFGTRLGRGGGSYDRALALARGSAPRWAMVYDGELLPPGVRAPAEPHDIRVHAAVTPADGVVVVG